MRICRSPLWPHHRLHNAQQGAVGHVEIGQEPLSGAHSVPWHDHQVGHEFYSLFLAALLGQPGHGISELFKHGIDVPVNPLRHRPTGAFPP